MWFTAIGLLVSSVHRRHAPLPLSASRKPVIASTEGISELAALDILNEMTLIDVQCPSSICEAPIPTNFVLKSPSIPNNESPIVLVHSFDSSCT